MRFSSTILERDGTTVEAELDAVDAQALHEELHRQGRILVRVEPLAGNRQATGGGRALAPRRMLLLTQALHEALDAGVPLLTAFHAVGAQERDARLGLMLEDLASRVAAGQPLADALAAHPRAFSPVYCALVRAGEQSGSLPTVLRSLASFQEWSIEIVGVLRQATIYPTIVCCAGYSMVLFMLSFVIPRLGDVLSKLGGKLPAASRLLIDASGLVAGHIVAIVAGSVLAFGVAVLALRTRAVKGWLVGVLGRLPVTGKVVATMAMAQFCRTFGVLLEAGLLMPNALELCGAATLRADFRERIERCRTAILGGARLGEAAENVALMPPVALSMLQVGEEAGRLPRTFERLGRLYDREAKDAVKRALGLLEPVVTVLLGLVVGGIAVLVVTTIYSAMRGIGK